MNYGHNCKLNQLTREQLLEMFDPSVHERILSILHQPGVNGIAVFENQMFDSSHFGDRTAVIYGPGCTFKTLADIEGGHLNDLPSQRQYPVAYYEKEEQQCLVSEASST